MNGENLLASKEFHNLGAITAKAANHPCFNRLCGAAKQSSLDDGGFLEVDW